MDKRQLFMGVVFVTDGVDERFLAGAGDEQGALILDPGEEGDDTLIGDTTFSRLEIGQSTASSRGLASGSLAAGSVSAETGSRVVTARGNEHGLVLRIDGKADWDSIVKDVRGFLGGKKRFFEGAEISIEWLETMPARERCSELETMLQDDFGVSVPRRARMSPLSDSMEKKVAASGKSEIPIAREANTRVLGMGRFSSSSGSRGERKSADYEMSGEDSGGLFSRSGFNLGLDEGDFDREYVSRVAKLLGDDLGQEEEANARIFFGTLRSGQKIETPFSLIVVGDINPGADLIAGGDIVVLGSLRGTAHASAYDDEFQDRVIIALHMKPMQLRIGSIISRGADEVVDGPEIARIEERRIVVEAFNSKLFHKRKFKL